MGFSDSQGLHADLVDSSLASPFVKSVGGAHSRWFMKGHSSLRLGNSSGQNTLDTKKLTGEMKIVLKRNNTNLDGEKLRAFGTKALTTGQG